MCLAKTRKAFWDTWLTDAQRLVSKLVQLRQDLATADPSRLILLLAETIHTDTGQSRLIQHFSKRFPRLMNCPVQPTPGQVAVDPSDTEKSTTSADGICPTGFCHTAQDVNRSMRGAVSTPVSAQISMQPSTQGLIERTATESRRTDGDPWSSSRCEHGMYEGLDVAIVLYGGIPIAVCHVRQRDKASACLSAKGVASDTP